MSKPSDRVSEALNLANMAVELDNQKDYPNAIKQYCRF